MHARTSAAVGVFVVSCWLFASLGTAEEPVSTMPVQGGGGAGACCALDDSCVETDQATCEGGGNTYQGPGTFCRSCLAGPFNGAPCNSRSDCGFLGNCAPACGCQCNWDLDPCVPDGAASLTDVLAATRCVRDQADPCGRPLSRCDVNCDGSVDMCDLGHVLEAFLNHPDPCSAPCGACCDQGEPHPPCIETTQSACTVGTYVGDGAVCDPSPCDCNNNGLTDECDLDCAGQAGACNVPGCGLSEDCNDNGSPDECEDGACCFIAQAGACVGGTFDELPCASDDECQGGVCVLADVQNCTVTTRELCEADPINGTFLGVCAECPQQNAVIVEEPGGDVFIHTIGPPVESCVPPGGRPSGRGVCTGPPFTDPWISPRSPNMCHNFGSAATDSVPAGFFGEGSDEYTGLLCVEGAALANNRGFSGADTLVGRSDDPFDRCELPSAEERSVEIELVALSLVSQGPITVTFNGGQNPEQWDVAVDVSPQGVVAGTPPSFLTARKTHCNGGTYTAFLCVQPRFTFRKVGAAGEVLVLDTFDAGTPAVCLDQTQPKPWTGDVETHVAATIDECSDMHPGIRQYNPETACDCNANGRRDLCDIEDGLAIDCNENTRPDLCEVAASAGCPQGLCTSGCAVDADEDCRPDECLCPVSSAPQSVAILDPGGTPHVLTANRFLIFRAGDPGRNQAIQVEFDSLPPPYDFWEDKTMWVGQPKQVSESGANADPTDPTVPPGTPTFWAAQLECTTTPVCRDWSTLGRFSVFGEGVIPSRLASTTGPIDIPARYLVRVIDCDPLCPSDNPANFSAPLPIVNAGWGDTVLDLAQVPNLPPNEAVEVVDGLAILSRFSSSPTAIVKARADLEPRCLDLTINVPDALGALRDGFSGLPYPFAPTSATDPCASTCTNPLDSLP